MKLYRVLWRITNRKMQILPKSLKLASDQELALFAKAGNLHAYEELVKRYRDKIFSYTFRLLKDSDLAEDATQEAFIKAFKHLSTYKPEFKFTSWLYQIAKNYSLDILRQRKKLVLLHEHEESRETPILDKILRNEQIERVKNAVVQLPQIYKAPIVGYYYLNQSYQAIADSLGVPVNTVRTRLLRAKLLLAHEMASG